MIRCCLILLLSGQTAFPQVQKEKNLTALEIHQWTEKLSSEDWVQQAVALKHLGKWKVEQSVPVIQKIFEQGKSSWIKGQAMLTLAQIQGEEMIPAAQKAAKEKDPILRRAALQTLDLVGGTASTSIARELLEDSDMKVKALAVALYASQFPEEAWPKVDSLTPPDKESISKDLLRALAHVGSAEALARLETLFHAPKANDRRKKDVLQALGMAKDNAIGLLARLTTRFEPNQPEFQVGQKLLAFRPQAKLSATLKEMLLT